MAPEKSSPLDIAASAASADSDLLRGTPCWSTTARRTVRSPRSRIRAETSSAALACQSVKSRCRATKPGWPTPAALNSSCVLTGPLLSHVVEQRHGKIVGLDVGQGQEGLRTLHAGNLEDRGQQQAAQVRMVADPEPDQEVEPAGDHAHVLGLGQLP